MKASEVIKKLQEIIEKEGDLVCTIWDAGFQCEVWQITTENKLDAEEQVINIS